MKGRIYVVELPDGPASLLFLTKRAARETIARQRHFFTSWSQARIVEYVPKKTPTGTRNPK